MRRLEDDLPRMAAEPILFSPTKKKLVWAWMRWYDECAPGMLAHMITPEQFDELAVKAGRPTRDKDGQPWVMVSADTVEGAFELIGKTCEPELVVRLNKLFAFHSNKKPKRRK